jgi:transcriptional regulator with XRE-family HTH domain
MEDTVDDDTLRQFVAQGMSQREIARQTGIPRSTLQNRLKALQVYEVHRGTPTILPRQTPEVDLSPQTLAELDAITADLLEVAAWWRSRKLHRVDPRGPRTTKRQTWHVDVEWIARAREAADAEGVTQADIVDRAFTQFFERSR